MKRSVALLLVLGACVSAPKRVATPMPAPRPAPRAIPAPPPVAWEDRARTPGTWTYRADSPLASFGADGGTWMLQVQCRKPEGRIILSRATGPGPGAMTVRTTTLSRTLAVKSMIHADAWPPVTGDAELSATDPLLDAIIYSRGKFMVSVAGQPDLILPPWPEIARVVEDCRN